MANELEKEEVATESWSKKALILAYAMVWCIYFINTMQQGIAGNLTPYITSSFQQHSLTATITVISSLIGGLVKLPLAKLLDIWGRPHGFALCVALLTIGLVIMAACKNVEMYATAQVLYWVGYNGLTYTMSVFITDTSALRNRALIFAFASSPYIITTWLGGHIATRILAGIGFAWGFGIFAVEAIKFYLVEFDIVGVVLVVAGSALFLFPFNLYSKHPEGLQSPSIIALIVIGGVLVVAFALWEIFWAPVKFLPWKLLNDRTVLGACCLAAVLLVSYYTWSAYFSSFLQVVIGLDLNQASYITNIYSTVACLWSLVVGAIVRWSGRFKWLALYFGVPLMIAGVGLMLHLGPDFDIGYIILCQVLVALAGGTLSVCKQIAVMAAVEHRFTERQYVAVVLAVESMFSSLGGAVGSTVAAAIWQGVFSAKLKEYLVADAKGDARNSTKDSINDYLSGIYGSLTTQISYPEGSVQKISIVRAYGDAQSVMLTVATSVLVLAIVATAVWKDIRIESFK
ncbi:siderophore iron transporter mirB [Colletotrichum truncatum]|uniref:Siderophore iron transporter mirB n=1 Tax=Colletotrichum truncatum TaxID=5467 RepID=A0ACC3Z990_COLTU|nr:siderophore iron transporter mirB [Colletotrichum truncatum]KAF6793569.1 siderophore iron transporter mirB [Colletotrichum truncatum]